MGAEIAEEEGERGLRIQNRIFVRDLSGKNGCFGSFYICPELTKLLKIKGEGDGASGRT